MSGICERHAKLHDYTVDRQGHYQNLSTVLESRQVKLSTVLDGAESAYAQRLNTKYFTTSFKQI